MYPGDTLTLLAYATKHYEENPDHIILVLLNGVECVTCGDHAHFKITGVMIRHNDDWSEQEEIDVTDYFFEIQYNVTDYFKEEQKVPL